MTTDELAPFFESRETRTGRLPQEARSSFTLAEQSAVAAGEKDFGDRQFVSLWLARRTGMPRKDVLTNFDAIAGRFFGQGATAATAYDAIANAYKQAGGSAEAGDSVVNQKPAGAAGGEEEEYAETEGLAKIGRGVLMQNTEQAGRSTGAGFEEFAQRVPAGLYSQASVIAGAPGRPKSVFENRTYLDLHRQREQILRPPFWPHAYPKQLNEGEQARVAKLDADMAKLRDRQDEENRTRLKDFSTSAGKDVAEEYRRLAGFWYELSGDASKRWAVDPEFEKTAMGSFFKSAGSVPATAALAVMGPVGWAGLESSFYADAERERMQKEGAAYDPQKAAAANLASALPQAALERAFGVERLLNKVLGEMPKQAGKVSFGDFARHFVKSGLTAGAEEAITEPTQGFWNDYVASIAYDQGRELFTPEAAKQRLIESVSAFALGFLFGGGVQAVGDVDQNRRVSAGERYLTTREGQALTEHDFTVLRGVKSDQELMATAPDEETGRLLLAAVNGDKAAQASYNNRTLAALFVDTEGVDVGGMMLGTINDVPTVKMADGVVIPLDVTKEEDRAFLDNFKREAVKVKATQDTMAELQKRHGADLEASQPTKLATLEERVASGQMTQEQADDALAVAKEINGLAKELTLADVAPEGSATTRQDAEGLWKMVVEVAQSADPTKAIEEVSEAYIHRAYKTQNLVPADLNAARMRWHEQNGEADAGAGFEGEALDRANIEWFSKRVIDYALANRKTELPGGWGKWLRTLGEQLKKLLKGATRMKKLLRDGKLDPELEAWMKGALGMVPEGQAFAGTNERAAAMADQGNAEAAPTISEVDQEMMNTALADESFPVIERAESGDFLVSAPGGRFLGQAPTIEEAQDFALSWFDKNARDEERQSAQQDAGEGDANELMGVVRKLGLPAPSMEPTFGGELRAIAENMPTAQRLRTFRKKAADLDTLRQYVNEQGFQFETVTDFLDALDRSSRGEKVYGNKGTDEQVTFGMGRATPADTSNVLRLPDGSHLVGPTTFAIAAYHGTPHKVDRFTVEAIGTGEGAQVYGWGLYFAQAKVVADGYRKKLSAGSAPPLWVLKEYFTPGRLVPAYGGTDRVISFNPGEAEHDWSVTVIAVKTDGSEIPGERPRRHQTQPRDYALRAAGINWEPGNLYGVELLPDVEEFLDWDLSWDDQSSKVQSAIDDMIRATFPEEVILWWEKASSQMDGADIYKALVSELRGEEEDAKRRASELLAKAGIPGIRYLDGGSRGAVANMITGPADENLTRNFVLFDDKLVKIISENGQPVEQPGTKTEQVSFALAPKTDSEAFKAWFQDSKVVDADGKPMVVYHGTSAKFTKFNLKKQTQGIIWFTSNRAKIDRGEVGAQGKGVVMELYASIQNPAGWAEYDKLGLYEFKGRGFDGAILPDGEGGFDGFVFESAQLKSATKNRGTFDPEDPRITFATTGVPQNAQQSLQAQASALRAKKLAASAQLAARLRSGTPLPKRAALVRRSTQASLLARLAMPISSRLKVVNPKLAQRLRRFEFDLGKRIQADFAQVEGFIRGFEQMRDADARMLDLALKNGDTDTRDTILTAYNLTGEFAKVQAVLDATRDRAKAAGYDFGEVQDYFPRKVNDVDGLFMHYYGKPQGGRIEEVLAEAAKAAAAQGRTLTQEERVEIVNSVLRGFRPPESKPSNLKARKTDVVDVDADQFYADSIQALASYIDQMNTALEKRRFFGKFAVVMQSATGGTYSSNKLALDASIGGIVEDMIAAGDITRAQQAEVQAVLQARFSNEASSPFIRGFKSLSYMGTMGQVTSAMTQLTDLAFSMYETGVFDSIVAGAKAVTRQSKITRKDLGLETVADEFRYQGGMSKAVDRVFKLVGIHYLDMVGKETLVNARFAQLQRHAAAGKLDAKARDLITTSFGPTIAPRVIGDLARGVRNEDTLFATYSILADYQPINLSEYPEFYLRHPNGRVFYMLKSFMLKQVDSFRREAFSLIVHGNAKQKATGFKNLIHLAGLLYMVGMPVDWLKDMIMGRDPQLTDLAVDNVFKLLGVNRWNLYQFRERKNPVEAALLLVAPPAPFLVYPMQDARTVASNIAKGDDINPGEFESFRMLPFIGSPIYWWWGGGRVKIEEKKQKRQAGRVNQ